MQPTCNPGEFVFVTVENTDSIPRTDTLMEFKEAEGITIVLKREKADELNLSYSFIASWITLKVQSSLEAVGLTAAFAAELTKHKISCNAVAAYHHDHIFVAKQDEDKAMRVLRDLTKTM